MLSSTTTAHAREVIWKTEKMKLMDAEVFQVSVLRSIEKMSTEERQKENQLTKEKLEQFTKNLLQVLLIEHGTLSNGINAVHIETVLTTMGALIGFSSQAAIHEAYIATGRTTDKQVFLIAGINNGDQYYFGDSINYMLFEGAGSTPWKVISSAATSLGAKNLPVMAELAEHSAEQLGKAGFGVPRLPEQHMPHTMPMELLNKYWNPVRNMMLLESRNATEWPFMLAVAATSLVMEGKEVIMPEMATKIIFESAIPMSHVDPKKVYQGLVLRK